MDYKKFYAEIADWILHVNYMAMQHGMESYLFWNWVSHSIGELANKYQNNQLVIRQLAMLYMWLEDVYLEQQSKEGA
ncbi:MULTISPECIES: hypothetical protein [unclassified Ureibacillus]|uniref:hypothetical protein n=1 Tax=unclassified Ureibacillus TaxID=2638520 RepID=UPI0030F81176